MTKQVKYWNKLNILIHSENDKVLKQGKDNTLTISYNDIQSLIVPSNIAAIYCLISQSQFNMYILPGTTYRVEFLT